MKSRFYTLLYTVVLGAYWMSCTPKVLVRDRAETTQLSDSSWQVSRDSLRFQEQQQKESIQNMRLQHLSLSTPDSLGRQYIQKITLMESDGIKKENRFSSFSKNNQEKTHSVSKQSNRLKEVVKEEKHVGVAFHWLVVLCSALFILLLTLAIPALKRMYNKILSK